MLRLAACAAVLAVSFCAPAFAASGNPLISQLELSCVQTGAVASAAIAQADKDGWIPVTDEAVLAKARALDMLDPVARSASTPDGELVLIAGQGKFPGDDLNVDMCMVLQAGAPDEALKAATRAWVGVVPVRGDAAGEIYAFKAVNGVRTGYAPDAGPDSVLSDAAKGLLQFVIRRADGEANMLLYGVSRAR